MSAPKSWWSQLSAVLLPTVGGVLLYLGYLAWPAGRLRALVWWIVGLVFIGAGLLFVLRPKPLTSWLGARAHALWRVMYGWVRSTTGLDPQKPMGTWAVRLLVVYLMVLAITGVWTMVTLWGARADQALEVPSVAAIAPAGGVSGTGLALQRLIPDTVSAGPGQRTVRLVGTGFLPTSRVLLDGQPHNGGRYVDATHMVLDLADADLEHSAVRFVSVAEGDVRTRALPLVIRSESDVMVAWHPPFGAERSLTLEVRFILLVIAMGALGGVVASFQSLAAYRGEGKLTKSWFLHYWVSPFLGAGVAFILYAVIRAGFLSGTSMQLDGGGAPWGVVAISGLAGLFHDKALLKLREVFLTLFNPRDTRSGKIEHPLAGALQIKTTSLTPATHGQPYEEHLDAAGGESPYDWSVTPDLPAGLNLDPGSGKISGTPPAAVPAATYTFTVRDMSRASVDVRLTFQVQ